MIDFFKTWLPQIISYAELVSDGRLRRTWEAGSQETSAYYTGELDEQVFGDLQSEDIDKELAIHLTDHPNLAASIQSFLRSLGELILKADRDLDVERWGSRKLDTAEVQAIFEWEEWRATEACANDVLAQASLAGFSSRDFEPL
ncbi:hypothetical protein IP78_03790 [Brevundimonas sp. AAP58]|uniref:hypothetical protein n=1 Tax=Brevundimonas sp. AAP58 TaxID=1523422 RepID=UPI0006B9D111|nr:hypothetical protein [Brevundimonas sp. AAP58]KPF82441.1 hypothetical protein IP78_03790 [Brevundimonas sp. AAP58]